MFQSTAQSQVGSSAQLLNSIQQAIPDAEAAVIGEHGTRKNDPPEPGRRDSTTDDMVLVLCVSRSFFALHEWPHRDRGPQFSLLGAELLPSDVVQVAWSIQAAALQFFLATCRSLRHCHNSLGCYSSVRLRAVHAVHGNGPICYH